MNQGLDGPASRALPAPRVLGADALGIRKRSRVLAIALVAACSSPEPAEPATRTTEPAARTTEPAAATSAPAAPAAPPAAAPAPAPLAEPSAADPLLDALGDPGPEDRLGAMPGALADRAAPPRGCVLEDEDGTRVLAEAGPPAVLADRDGFLVAACDRTGVALVRIRPGALPQPVGTLPLEAPPSRQAPPALARTAEAEATLALVDGRGRVLAASFDPSLAAISPSAQTVYESGADARFAPAVAAIATGSARRAIAWTDGGTPMRLRLALVERGRVVSTHDLSPDAGGGAAPIFVEGERAPSVMFLDPRAAISVAHRSRLGADGTPGPTEVSRPLNLTSEPPAIAAATAGGHTWLAYAAVGNGATRAVGLVEAVGTGAPAALVPGLGYGEPLGIDAVVAGPIVIFSVEAPTAAPAEAPHEVRLRVVDARGPGEALVLPAPSADPALAVRDDGLLAVAYRAGSSVLVRFARCAP